MNREPAQPATKHLSFNDLRAVLTVALRAGQLLLLYGADTQRVEETVQRLGIALGADKMEVYVTPTGIIASALGDQEHRTQIVRVIGSGVDLNRISAINGLSRRIAADHLTRHEVAATLEQIAQQPRLYGRWSTVLTVGLACACFSQLFGGTWREFVAVFVAAALAMLLRQTLFQLEINALLHVPLNAVVATLIVLLLGQAIGMQRTDVAVPSAVLMLVPGVLSITALSDLIGGFLLSAVARGAQAILTIVEIGVGVALGLRLLHTLGWIA